VFQKFYFRGELIPAINLRKRFSLDSKEISVDDRFIIINTEKRKLALVVDAVEEIRKIKAEELSKADVLLPVNKRSQRNKLGLESTFVLRDQNGIIIIYDVEKLLRSELEIQLDQLIQVQQE
jgi:purine-binding chemotaxis protein CheW